MIKDKTKQVTKTILRPFEHFFEMQSSGGILLIIGAAVAMIWSNSPFGNEYFDILARELTLGYGSFQLSKPLLLWINDGLMAIFFFVIGLEMKREILAGELSTLKEAAMPVAAAIGGMLVPAIIFMIIAGDAGMSKGWGIPIATDIAFSLGILSLLGQRVPIGLKIFLTALAIVDDIGAILIIALFYSQDIHWNYLLIAGGLLSLLLLFNYFDFRKISFYILIGLVVWFCFLKAGVHPTVAGVLLAFTIPSNRKMKMRSFLEGARAELQVFENTDWPDSKVILTEKQIEAIDCIAESVSKVQSPVQRLENNLSGFVSNLVMPVFALANASIVFGGEFKILNKLALGIVAGLLIGKVLGISFFSWLSVKLGWSQLPAGVNWKQIIGVGFLAGIGFTMSLFITNLAFTDAVLIDKAKIGILTASLVAGIIGFIILKRDLK